MKKFLLLLSAIMFVGFIISGCGSEEEASNNNEGDTFEENNAEEQNENTEEEVEEEPETDDLNEATTASEASTDFAELISYMEEETEGTTEILYENNEAQIHEMDGVSVSIDAYTLVELNDFHTNFSIPFNDQTDGGVIIAQYTVTNDLDEDVYYMPAFYLSFTGAEKAYNNYRELLPEEEQLPVKLAPSNDYLLRAGESVTGYYTYPFGEQELETVLEVSTVAIEVPPAQAEKGEFSSPIGSKGQFTLSLNEAGAEKLAVNKAFYQDKATVEDMGDKKMLKEETDIGESEQLGDVEVTFEGYQFTEFTPNSYEAPRFENFSNGVVLLTMKFHLDNKGSDQIGLSSISSKLTVNDGTQWLLSEGMLLNYSYNDVIEVGQSEEFLQVFVLDQEQYEKIWKDKAFEVEVGPIRNKESEDISKGKKAVFEF